MTTANDQWVRRTISVLIDTGRVGDPSWRGSSWTLLALIGPGSVPFAVLMLLVQNQVLRSEYSIGWLALPLAVANAASIVLARFRPVLAWLLLNATFVATALLSPVRTGEPWPWTVAGLFALLIVQFGVARDCRVRAAIGTWSVGFLLVLWASSRFNTETAAQNLTLVSLLSVAAAAIGLAVRATRRARRRVGEEERLTAAERARREQLEDRARIARELHDVVAHHMSVISVQAATAEYRLPELRADVRDEFRSIGGQARQSLTEMRRLLGVLRGENEAAETAPQPDLDRLPELVESVRRAGIEVSLAVDVGEPPSAAVALTGYRVVQEALSNVVRYAPGAATAVTVATTATALLVDVRNEPPPATPDTTVTGGGYGLTGMRERVVLLGGELTAAPTTEGGFAVHAEIPFAPDGEQS